MYDFDKLLNDYAIDHLPLNSRGYTSIQCPLCHSSGKYHGGFHENGYYICWKCSCKNINEVIKILTGQFWHDIRDQYQTDIIGTSAIRQERKTQKPSSLSLPIGTGPLNERARDYLKNRGFNPDILAELYGLQSTGIYGSFNFRIIIPIYFKKQLVSYTSRDYTGQASIRYLSCRSNEEIINHKNLLYGYDQVPGEHVICVEGPADKWKMGIYSVATFGTGFKPEQISLLSGFKKITLLYDSGEEAKEKGDRLGNLLASLGKDVDAIYLKEGDPGGLSQNEADGLLRDILSF